MSKTPTITSNGITAKLSTNARGKLSVHWCSNWSQIDELVSAGWLKKSFGSGDTFGAVEFVITGRGKRICQPINIPFVTERETPNKGE